MQILFVSGVISADNRYMIFFGKITCCGADHHRMMDMNHIKISFLKSAFYLWVQTVWHREPACYTFQQSPVSDHICFFLLVVVTWRKYGNLMTKGPQTFRQFLYGDWHAGYKWFIAVCHHGNFHNRHILSFSLSQARYPNNVSPKKYPAPTNTRFHTKIPNVELII